MSDTANLLFHDIPERNSDMYYLSGFLAPDAVTHFQFANKSVLAVSPLEYGRAVKQAQVDEVIDTLALLKENTQENLKKMSREAQVIALMARRENTLVFEVPKSFPLGLADELRAVDLELTVMNQPQLPQRECKTQEEMAKIKDAVSVTERLFHHVITILHECTIDAGMLKWQGEWLTSEILHTQIKLEALKRGFIADHPIVAGGDQACDPHETGHGVLPAHQLIIVDIFPKSQTHGYWGDLTRTFLKGKASPEQVKLVETVKAAQDIALDTMANGVNAASVHQNVEEHFEKAGYRTEIKNGTYTGFFHGTGHGLGLDIHEMPRLGKNVKDVLAENMVITVEPGLYYPGLGGCRIEDDVRVTQDGVEMLSDLSYDWLID